MAIFMKLFKSYIFYLLSAFGISMGIIANVGVSSYNSMNLAISTAVSIRIGTISIIFNILFLLVYIILTHFKHKSKYLIQAISVILFGALINIFTYDVLGGITHLIYYQRILFLAIGTMVSGLSIGGIIHYNIITFPIESVCVRLSELTHFSFIRLRYMVDLISVTVSITLSLMNDLPLFVREGTIISMLLLSFTMNISKRFFENTIKI